MNPAPQPLKLLLGAVGGQGGGLLGDWLDLAAQHAGYPCQATSTPGVAQRTGATIYYVELYPEPNPPGTPLFCLYPTPGDLDLVATLEPLEAGRALDRGFITAQTTLVSPIDRIYSTAEKVVAGDGRVDLAPLLGRLRAAARRTVLFDGSGLGLSLNAALLGAVAASGVLPLGADDYRAAIEQRGVAVAANLAGFETGMRLADGDAPQPRSDRFDAAPAGLAAEVAALPEALRPLAGHATARLTAYQDPEYARLYLDRLAPFVALEADDPALPLASEVARRLAAWMSYEDIIRVAQLKSRPGRLAQVRAEMGAADGDAIEFYDHLRPGRAELAALLPPVLARLLNRRRPRGPGAAGRPMRLRTSSPWGYGAMRLLARLRPLRRRGAGFLDEQRRITQWLAAVQATAEVDRALAAGLAGLGFLARGYGETRRRDLGRLAALLDGWSDRLVRDRQAAAAALEALQSGARTDPDHYAQDA